MRSVTRSVVILGFRVEGRGLRGAGEETGTGAAGTAAPVPVAGEEAPTLEDEVGVSADGESSGRIPTARRVLSVKPSMEAQTEARRVVGKFLSW